MLWFLPVSLSQCLLTCSCLAEQPLFRSSGGFPRPSPAWGSSAPSQSHSAEGSWPGGLSYNSLFQKNQCWSLSARSGPSLWVWQLPAPWVTLKGASRVAQNASLHFWLLHRIMELAATTVTANVCLTQPKKEPSKTHREANSCQMNFSPIPQPETVLEQFKGHQEPQPALFSSNLCFTPRFSLCKDLGVKIYRRLPQFVIFPGRFFPVSIKGVSFSTFELQENRNGRRGEKKWNKDNRNLGWITGETSVS